jgi:hypothetical protein
VWTGAGAMVRPMAAKPKAIERAVGMMGDFIGAPWKVGHL